MNQSSFQRSRLSLAFGIVTAAVAVGATLGSLVVLLLGNGYLGCLILGGGSALLGILRAAWPGRPWFASRSRVTDVVAYLVVGCGVMLLAPWANALAA